MQAKTLQSYPTESRTALYTTLSSIYDRDFWLKAVNDWKPLTIFGKRFILDVWQSFELNHLLYYTRALLFVLGRCCLYYSTFTAWKVSLFGGFLVRIYRIQSGCAKIRAIKTPNMDIFMQSLLQCFNTLTPCGH